MNTVLRYYAVLSLFIINLAANPINDYAEKSDVRIDAIKDGSNIDPVTDRLSVVHETPELIRDLPGVGSLADRADAYVIGGGYQWWASCTSPELDGAEFGFLSRRPLSGGPSERVSNTSHCPNGKWGANEDGLYYFENGSILLRTNDDPSSVQVAVMPVIGIDKSIIFGATSLYWTHNGRPMRANRFEDQHVIPSILSTATLTNTSNLIWRGNLLNWLGSGKLWSLPADCQVDPPSSPTSCLNARVEISRSGAPAASGTSAIHLLDARIGSSSPSPFAPQTSPLWSTDRLIRGTYADYEFNDFRFRTVYTTPTVSGNTYRFGSNLISDRTYLYWVESRTVCDSVEGICWQGDGQLMKWRQSPSANDPFSTPKPIFIHTNGIEPLGENNHLHVEGGWLYLFVSNVSGSSTQLARIRTSAVPQYPDVAFVDWEVTQGIQNPSDVTGSQGISVPLVRGKETWVRVTGQVSGGRLLGVRALLAGWRNNTKLGSLYAVEDLDFPLKSGEMQGTRSDINTQWLFALPQEWVEGESLRLELTLNPSRVFQEPVTNNNSRQRTFQLSAEMPVCVRFARVLANGIASSLWGPEHMTQLDVVRKLFPIHRIKSTSYSSLMREAHWSWSWPPWTYSSYEWRDDQTWMINKLGRWDNFADTPSECIQGGLYGRTLSAGVLAPSATTSGGVARVGKSQSFSTLPTMNGNNWWSPDAKIMAHEFGHNFGRLHVDCGNPDNTDTSYPYTDPCTIDNPGQSEHHGFAVWDKRILIPSQHSDVMSYGGRRWISPYTFNAIKVANLDTFLMRANARKFEALALADRVIYVSGQIVSTPTHSALLDVAYSVSPEQLSPGVLWNLASLSRHDTNAAHRTNPESEAALTYALRAISINGSVVAEAPFVVDVDSRNAGNNVGFQVAFESSTSPITKLQVLRNGGVIAEQQFGAHAPSITILTPQAGQQITQMLTVRVHAFDYDPADRVQLMLQASDDDGTTWQTIGDIERPALVRDTYEESFEVTDALRASANGAARVRVLASDGVNTSIQEVIGLTFANRSPRIAIIEPHIGYAGRADQSVRLDALIEDAEDGDRLIASWRVDGNISKPIDAVGAVTNLIGLGSGTYSLSLNVTDSQGKFAQAERQFEIRPLVVSAFSVTALNPDCNTSVWTGQPKVTLRPYEDGSSASVRFGRTTKGLWICAAGLRRDIAKLSEVSIRIDPDLSSAGAPTSKTLEIVVAESGTIKRFLGKSETETRGGGGAIASVANDPWDDEIWQTAVFLPAALLGGLDRTIGFAVAHNTKGQAPAEYAWPHGSKRSVPLHYSALVLGELPTLDSVTPTTSTVVFPNIIAQDATEILTVAGSGFTTSHRVRISDTFELSTTWVSTRQLTAQLPVALRRQAMMTNISVFASSGSSGALPFSVVNPVPKLDRIVYSETSLTLSGSDIVNTAYVMWNGEAISATRISQNTINVPLPTNASPTGYTVRVSVVNPGPGGGGSREVEHRIARVHLPIVLGSAGILDRK